MFDESEGLQTNTLLLLVLLNLAPPPPTQLSLWPQPPA